MRVVADTSPICYLVQIGCPDLLRDLFGSVLIPPAVRAELSHPGAGPLLQSWIERSPSWLQVVAPLHPPAFDLQRLHPGEREAIALAFSLTQTC